MYLWFPDTRTETLPLVSLPTHERNIQQNKSMDTFSNDKHKRKRILQVFFSNIHLWCHCTLQCPCWMSYSFYMLHCPNSQLRLHLCDINLWFILMCIHSDVKKPDNIHEFKIHLMSKTYVFQHVEIMIIYLHDLLCLLGASCNTDWYWHF